MTKKKILYIANVDFFIVSHRLNLALEAKKRGHDVHIACEFTDKYDYLNQFGFFLHSLSYKRSNKFPLFMNEIRAFIEILNLIKNLKPNLIHTISLKPTIYVGLVANFFSKKKFVISITGLGYVFNNYNLKALFLKRIVLVLFKYIFKNKNISTIFQNSHNKSYLESMGVNFSGQVKIIKGSGVDIKDFKIIEEPKDHFRVIMVSRLLKDKGVREFAEASKILFEKKSKIRMIIVGGIDKNPMSIKEEEIIEWKNNNNIEWWGFKKNIPKIMSLANIVCLPSYHEGFPKVLIEAAAASRAVITTNVPGCRDAIIPDKTGILIPPKSSLDLSIAIQKLKNDDQKRFKMGLEARKHAEKYFNLDKITKEHFDLYFAE